MSLFHNLRLKYPYSNTQTLGVSQLVYAASMLSVPNEVIKIVQTQLFSLLWKTKKDKIKRGVIFQPLAEGGLDFILFFFFHNGEILTLSMDK